MTFILGILLFFTDYRIAFLSLADIALILFLVKAIYAGYKIQLEKNRIIWLAVILIGCVIACIYGSVRSYFSIIEFIGSFAKLCLYLLSTLVLPKYFADRKFDFIRITKTFLYFTVVCGCLQLGIATIFGVESWPLYSLGSQFFGISGYESMLVNNGMIRARSFFSEPAAYAIVISLAYIILLYNNKYNSRKHIIIDTVVYFVGIITASSVSGYGMAALILAIYFVHIKKVKYFKRMLMLIVPATLAGVMFLARNPYILGRIENLFALKDHSGVVRTIGSIIYLKYVPFWGVGLGNGAGYYNSLPDEIKNLYWFSGSGEFYNIFVVAIISMGYIGAAGFVMYLYSVFRRNKRMFLSLCVVFFSTGRLFTPTIWVFMIIFMTIECIRREEIKESKEIIARNKCGDPTEVGVESI